jgi:hypothetical protein
LPSRPVLAAALAIGLVSLAAAAPPASGRYDGRLCVATGTADPECGPAAITVRGRRELQVQIADIVYRLRLHSSQLDLVLMHGTMQIDGFTANYEWEGRTLLFSDPDKPVRYRVTLEDTRR